MGLRRRHTRRVFLYRLTFMGGGVVLLGLGGSNVEQGVPPTAALAPITEARARGLIESAIEKRLKRSLSSIAKQTLTRYLMAVAGPGGMLSSPSRRMERGVCSAGLMTTVLPQAIAGAIFQVAI